MALVLIAWVLFFVLVIMAAMGVAGVFHRRGIDEVMFAGACGIWLLAMGLLILGLITMFGT